MCSVLPWPLLPRLLGPQVGLFGAPQEPLEPEGGEDLAPVRAERHRQVREILLLAQNAPKTLLWKLL